jgi:tRNA(fMet)-specific endonuclease VapC
VVFLLDTNSVSDLIRNPRGNVAARIAEVGEHNVCTSIIVAAELRYGVAKRGGRRFAGRVEEVLTACGVVALETPVDTTYGRLRADLERRGQPIGGNDLWIAAHALTLRHTLVTANEREFARVPRLKCVNWL